MKIIVASKNPVKIEATFEAFLSAFKSIIDIEGVNIKSGVNEQPMTNEETKTGAINRAKNAKILFPKSDYWVGIEGGVNPVDDELETFGWVAIISENKMGKARSATFYLPEIVAKRIKNGEELGPVNDSIFKRSNSKHNSGAVGILTKDTIIRKELYRQALVLALIPFINKELYF